MAQAARGAHFDSAAMLFDVAPVISKRGLPSLFRILDHGFERNEVRRVVQDNPTFLLEKTLQFAGGHQESFFQAMPLRTVRMISQVIDYMVTRATSLLNSYLPPNGMYSKLHQIIVLSITR